MKSLIAFSVHHLAHPDAMNDNYSSDDWASISGSTAAFSSWSEWHGWVLKLQWPTSAVPAHAIILYLVWQMSDLYDSEPGAIFLFLLKIPDPILMFGSLFPKKKTKNLKKYMFKIWFGALFCSGLFCLVPFFLSLY